VLFSLCVAGVERIDVIVVDVEPIFSLEEEEKEPGDLVNRLENDVSPHNLVDNHVGLLGREATDVCMRRLSGEGKSGESVHDQVDPEHLCGGERGFVEDASTCEDDEHGDDVNGQLELKELADVVIDVTAVPDSGQDRAEVVIKERDVTSALGDIGAGNAHGKADIGAVKSRGVVGAITSDGDGLSTTDQAINEHELVIRRRASHDLQLVLNLLELMHIINFGNDFDLEFIRTVAFFTIAVHFFLLRCLDLLDAATDLVAEVYTLHSDHSGGLERLFVCWLYEISFISLNLVQVSLGQDAGLHRDGLGSCEGVASDHANVDASLVATRDSLCDAFSKRVLEAKHHNHGQVRLDLLGSIFTVLHLIELIKRDVTVGDD